MVRVHVRFFTVLRDLVGEKEILMEFESEKVTVRDLLERLVNCYGREFREYVFDMVSGEVRGHLQLLVDGRNVVSLDGLDTELRDGSVFAIIPPVGGG